MTNINSYIEEKAERLLIESDCYLVPVDVEKCAAHLKVEIQTLDLEDNVSGFFVMKGESAYIGYNKTNPPNRVRFTLAHELGHYFLHAKDTPIFIDKNGQINRDHNSSTGELLIEREANAFAAALLMPEKLIREEVAKMKDVDEVSFISNLAMLFKVSDQAMTIRLTNLGLIDYNDFTA